MQLPDSASIESEICKRSLAEFIKRAWHVLEPDTDLKWSWHLDLICDRLEKVAGGDIKRLIINIPPGCMKSLTVTVFWPAWVWLHRPAWRVVSASYAKELSTRDSVRCRTLVESEWYKSLTKNEWALRRDQNVKTSFENTEKGSRLSISVGGATTGFRGDCTIVDDPLNIKERPTSEALESVFFWYRKSFWTRLNNQEEGTRVIIQQRTNEGDLVGRLMEEPDADEWETLILPMRFDPENAHPEDPREEEGELLSPELFSEKAVKDLEVALGAYEASAQLQQSPMPAGGGIFEPKWVKFWYDPERGVPPDVKWKDGTIAEQKPIPDGLGPVYHSWDCTFKEAETSDFVVGQAWRSKKAESYLIDQVRRKMGFGRTVTAVRDFRAKYPNTAGIWIEDKANGTAVIETLKGEIPGVIAVNPAGGKEARANAVQPLFEAGNVFLPHPSQFPWVWELLKELFGFPRSRHDDQVDALTQALNKLRKRVVIV